MNPSGCFWMRLWLGFSRKRIKSMLLLLLWCCWACMVSSVGNNKWVGRGGQVHCSAVPCTRATYCQGVRPPPPT